MVCLSASVCVGAKPPRGFNEVGGSNYVMYEVGREYLDSGTGWFKPGVLQPVVATFHLQKKADVRQQLKAMHDSGQRKIAIMMWHNHLPPKQLSLVLLLPQELIYFSFSPPNYKSTEAKQ